MLQSCLQSLTDSIHIELHNTLTQTILTLTNSKFILERRIKDELSCITLNLNTMRLH